MFDYATEETLGQFDDHSFSQRAVFFPNMDYIDYVRHDGVHIAQRVDRFLTLIWNETRTELVGFRIKGIHNFFIKKLQSVHNLSDDQFVPVRDLFIMIVTDLGEELFNDSDDASNSRADAYRLASQMAANDNVVWESALAA